MKLPHASIALALITTMVKASPTSHSAVHLVCTLDGQQGGWVIEADEREGSVLINSKLKFPATFTDSIISWRMGLKGDEMLSLSINRYTAEFVMGNDEFPVLRRGNCVKSKARQF